MVKVCGITRAEDARVAVLAGADLLGFVLAASPRQVSPERAADILAGVQGAAGVAVLVRPSPDRALALAQRVGAVRVQLHGVEPASWPRDFPFPVVFALPIGRNPPPTPAWPDARHWLLCDTASAEIWGGTGRSFDWHRIVPLARTVPTLLAGGLDPENVLDALRVVAPLGVDASTRLESAPGVKDPTRVRAFLEAVRRYDQEGPGA